MDFTKFDIGNCYCEFQRMIGSKLYEQNGELFLVISYDDILDSEVEAFQYAPFEVVFKMFGMISLFTFKFNEYIVDAPFNPFIKNHGLGKGVHENGGEIPITIYICEWTSGKLLVKRESMLPLEFCMKLEQLLAERKNEYMEQYSLESFNERMKEIYDNYLLDALYELSGDKELRCTV